MPKLKAEVTTKTEVDLSIGLRKKLKVAIGEFAELTAEKKAIEAKLAEKKTAIETLFADANEYEALEEGVRVVTPLGEVPLKIVKGMAAGRMNFKKLMTKFKLTPRDVDSCRDKPKPKKEYLGIWLPTDKDEEGEDE